MHANSFYLKMVGKTQWNLISPFSDDKCFTAVVTDAHFRFHCESFKNQFDDIFSISKEEQLYLVVMNNR